MMETLMKNIEAEIEKSTDIFISKISSKYNVSKSELMVIWKINQTILKI